MTTSVLNSSFFPTGAEPAVAGFAELTAAAPNSVDGFAAIFEATSAIPAMTEVVVPAINPVPTPIFSPLVFASVPVETTEPAPVTTEATSQEEPSSPLPLSPDAVGMSTLAPSVVVTPRETSFVEVAALAEPVARDEDEESFVERAVTTESSSSNQKVVRGNKSSDEVREDVADDASTPENKETMVLSPLPQSVAPVLPALPQIPVVFSKPTEVQGNAVMEERVSDAPVSTSVLDTADDARFQTDAGHPRAQENVTEAPRISRSEQPFAQAAPENAPYASLAAATEPISAPSKQSLPNTVTPREPTVPVAMAADGDVNDQTNRSPVAFEAALHSRAVRQPAQPTMSLPVSLEAPTAEATFTDQVATVQTPVAAIPALKRPATVAASPESALPGAQVRIAEAEVSEADVVQQVQVKTASVVSGERAVTDNGKNSPAAMTTVEGTRGVEEPVQEKFAADLKLRRNPRSVEKQSMMVSEKKVSLTIDKDKVTEAPLVLGTETAKEAAPMVHDIRQTRLIALGGENVAPASGVSGGVTHGQPMVERPTEAPATAAAATAVQVVRQISDAVDALAATERPGVNVRVKLDDVGVAVNVEFRNGEVRATFQTDSAELRDALSTAWQTHAAAVTDSKPYRFAEPVFASSSSQTPGGQSSQSQSFSMGGDTSRQHHQQQQPQSQSSAAELSPAFLSGAHQLRSAKTATLASAAPVSAVGASLSSRLEAFA